MPRHAFEGVDSELTPSACASLHHRITGLRFGAGDGIKLVLNSGSITQPELSSLVVQCNLVSCAVVQGPSGRVRGWRPTAVRQAEANQDQDEVDFRQMRKQALKRACRFPMAKSHGISSMEKSTYCRIFLCPAA